MSEKKFDDGGPAFPEVLPGNPGNRLEVGRGMSLWDYYAAHAPLDEAYLVNAQDFKAVAMAAANWADAMLAERKKRFGG